MIGDSPAIGLDVPEMEGSPSRAATPQDCAVAPAGMPLSRTLYLVGRPPLKQFTHFVQTHALQPEDEATLVERWATAARRIDALAQSEAGIADHAAVRPLDAEFAPWRDEFLADPIVRNSFNTLPTALAMVELDRLVVYQPHIDLTFVDGRADPLRPPLDAEALFKLCLPYGHATPPVAWSRAHGDRYVFASLSNDLRFLGAVPLRPEQLRDYAHTGHVVAVIGLVVGFGSNFLSAIYADGRLVLCNGSHRAYALRRMGVTHVPCVVEHVRSRDELDLVASSEVRRDPELYLSHPRPPMLRDYFDPELHVVITAARRVRQVTVKFETADGYAPAV